MRLKESIETIETESLRLEYDQSTRHWSLCEKDSNGWVNLIRGAYSSFSLADGQDFRTDDRQASIIITKKKISDLYGKGRSLKITSVQRGAELTTTLTIYEKGRAVLVSLQVRNKTSEKFPCSELNLFETAHDGGLNLGDSRWLAGLNGYQSWSESEIFELDHEEHTGYWHALLYSSEKNKSLLFGFVTNELAVNSFEINRPFGSKTVQLRSRSALRPLMLDPRQVLQSDKLLIQLGDPPATNLRRYAEVLYRFSTQKKEFRKTGAATAQIPTGWCSWYFFHSKVTEDKVIENLKAAHEHFRDVGLRYIQIDDGYQRAAGDWETNEKFPHGHRWLTNQIHKSGFLAGLWIAPFAVAASSALFRSHPDWVLKMEDGSPLRAAMLEHWGGEIYVLDPTIAEVRHWLTDLFRKITRHWRYDYVKIDFLYFVAEGTAYREPATAAQAYRMGLQAIRKGVGSKRFILGCGAPLGPSVPFVDGMRIGPDVEATWNGLIPSMAATASRFHYHNHAWYNDPDCLVVREPLTLGQARMWASLMALSGGMNLLGDHLPTLPWDRYALLKKTFPVFAEGGVPVDLFEPPKVIGISVQNQSGDVFRLSRLVKFSRGDDDQWKEPGFSDMDWPLVEIPSSWNDYDGGADRRDTGWYRLGFYLPTAWDPADVTIHLGRIADCDETYLNGAAIGSSGSMPPSFESASNLFRSYPIPKKLLNWKGQNILAIRVYSRGERPGLYSLRKLNLPRIWNLKVRKKFGHWNVVGVFNWGESPEKIEIPLSRLDLSSEETYLAYELWSEAFLGEFTEAIGLELPPTSSKLVAIHPLASRPLILSTSRHLTMGAVDLEKVEWNKKKQLLSGRSNNMVPGEYTLVVWLPSGFQLSRANPSAVLRGSTTMDSILKVTFDLKYLKPFNWELEFSRANK